MRGGRGEERVQHREGFEAHLLVVKGLITFPVYFLLFFFFFFQSRSIKKNSVHRRRIPTKLCENTCRHFFPRVRFAIFQIRIRLRGFPTNHTRGVPGNMAVIKPWRNRTCREIPHLIISLFTDVGWKFLFFRFLVVTYFLIRL